MQTITLYHKLFVFNKFCEFDKAVEISEVTPITTGPSQMIFETCSQSMAKLLASENLSDFEIVCQGESFPCHKSVLANKSGRLSSN